MIMGIGCLEWKFRATPIHEFKAEAESQPLTLSGRCLCMKFSSLLVMVTEEYLLQRYFQQLDLCLYPIFPLKDLIVLL